MHPYRLRNNLNEFGKSEKAVKSKMFASRHTSLRPQIIVTIIFTRERERKKTPPQSVKSDSRADNTYSSPFWRVFVLQS